MLMHRLQSGFYVVATDVVVFVVNGRVGGGCCASCCGWTEIIVIMSESLTLIDKHAQGTLDMIAVLTWITVITVK